MLDKNEVRQKLHDNGQDELRQKLVKKILIMQIAITLLGVVALVAGGITIWRGDYVQTIVDVLVLIGVGVLSRQFIKIRRALEEKSKR